MDYQEDPFADPTVIASEFPSAASFRGRLVIIEPVKLEKNVPSQDDPTKLSDRITATVSVIDGSGPVELMPRQVASGQFLDGPEHKGVWFSQDRIVGALLHKQTKQPLKMVLGRIQTFKPGQLAKKGNPWGITPATDEEKQIARDYLAKRYQAQAAADLAGPATTPFG